MPNDVGGSGGELLFVSSQLLQPGIIIESLYCITGQETRGIAFIIILSSIPV